MKARAAQIWDELERQLIEHCGLPNGRMLELARPGLIRRIGDALTGRAAAAKSVSPPLPRPNRKAAGALKASSGYVGWGVKPLPNDTVHDPMFAAMLERSCSRRTGYDGDDPVVYGRR